MNIRIFCLQIAMLCLLAISFPVMAGHRDDIDVVREAGEISGIVNYCGPSGSAKLMVYIPGTSFISITGPSGEFRLSYVPEGMYTLAVLQDGRIITTVNNVVVKRKKLTSVGTLAVCPDSDNDGHTAAGDCNDLNPKIYPGAIEKCDGVDNDCDEQVDEGCPVCTDADDDGFAAQSYCGKAADCADNDPAVNPAAAEACYDGVDNDCDGKVDDGCCVAPPGTPCGDVDEVGECRKGVYNSDCNCAGIIYPSEELCDGLDNDCDGLVDEDQAGLPMQEPCQLSAGVCSSAMMTCGGAAGWLPCDYGPNFELSETVCDGLDNDCDGELDEGCLPCTPGEQCYEFSSGTPNVGKCAYGTYDNACDCVGAIGPGTESCNYVDDDCNGAVDDNAWCPAGPNSTPICDRGACSIRCNAGWANCDLVSYNGCEVNTGTSLQHCGGCGRVCGGQNVAEAQCVSGVCHLTCNDGWGNCDGMSSNGCETNLNTSTFNCGGCGRICGGTCSLGVCQ